MIKSLHELDSRARTICFAGEKCPACKRDLVSMGKFIFCTEECGFGWEPVVTWAMWEDDPILRPAAQFWG